MPNIYDLLTPSNVVAYFESTPSKTYLGSALFPPKKQLGLDISFLRGRGGLPVQLQPAAFDANAPLRERIGVKLFNTEMPFFRERMLISEKERQQINTFLSSNNQQAADIILNGVYQDAKDLIDGAEVIAERMRMQLLTTGKISITATEERRAVEYDYGFDTNQFTTLVGTDAWTDNLNADPIGDIERLVQEGRTNLIMNSFTFGLMAKHPNVIDLLTAAVGTRLITRRAIIDFLNAEYGISIAIVDDTFLTEVGGTPEKFFPDYVITAVPPGTLGETVYGTTPEESDLLTGQNGAFDVSVVNTGVAVTTVKIPHPVNVQTIVSEIVLPSFPLADKVHILTVGVATP